MMVQINRSSTICFPEQGGHTMSRKLYPYQERVYRALMAGKNVIIQAPTGAGKTFAALYPYFENLVREGPSGEKPLPLTCRYAVPMRVLATQFQRECDNWFEHLDKKRGTRFVEQYGKLGVSIPSIQTGETPDDPQFESPLTFCTIDQLLASFIGTPYSIGPRMANMNVGAIVGSYLILDEFHLFPLERNSQGARTTTLAMLQMLQGFSPFVMMTATFSSGLLESLAKLLNAEVVRVSEQEELDTIMHGRERTISRADSVMTPEVILAAHAAAKGRNAGASLVVCNTVARAQDIYVRLRDELERRGQRSSYELHLLHSRFTKADRQEKSERLEELLGEHQWDDHGHFQGPDTIIVATQVVEVGLNISAGVLHTELAPANGIIQRAGRCARFVQQQGEVIIYPIPPKEDSEEISYLPYDKETCLATWEHLESMIAASGQDRASFSFFQEQELIDAVHTEADKAMIDSFGKNAIQIKREIMEVLATHERGRESELIRNVEQTSIIIHPQPQDDITIKPFAWESFGLHPGTLAGAWKALDERCATLGPNGPGWTMRELKPIGSSDEAGDVLGADADNDRQAQYTWDVLSQGTYGQIRTALRIALPPELAAYDKELGFRLLLDPAEPVGNWKSSAQIQSKGRSDWDLGKQGSYVEHISGLARAYHHSVQGELAWIARRLEHEMQLPGGKLDLAMKLAIACHDIGKLSKGWQAWAHAWQQLLVRKLGQGYAVQPGREWLAKTNRLDWREEQELRKEMKLSRPHHACEGAIASAMLIGQRLAEGLDEAQYESGCTLSQAAISAIARHHTPLASTHEAVSWDNEARVAIDAALIACGQDPDSPHSVQLGAMPKGEVDREYLLSPSTPSPREILATLLGFVLVRALRLCDQRAEHDL
jgi:CRISPR-associated endonuclease/helicase Cas3